MYVFPTELAASAWADRALVITDAGSVAAERFIAWDTFKSSSIRSQRQDKKSIPAVLRRMFVLKLIDENAELCRARQEPLFRSLINPSYAQTAQPFAAWIAGLLPSLASWYERLSGVQSGERRFKQDLPAGADEEDRDLLTLAVRYSNFLESKSLFEPAWEKPPFRADGNTYIIFYPEVIADFCEYERLLSGTPHVRLFRTPDAESLPRQHIYCCADSRSELSFIAAYISRLHRQGIPWNGVNLHIADIDAYAPYIERELKLHSIPAVRKAGKPLASYGAGRFFRLVSDCVSKRFSFSSIRALLLDGNLPWRDTDAIGQLIEFGKKNNCVCSWQENGRSIDIWEQAFAGPAGTGEQRARSFYAALKQKTVSLAAAASFEEIRRRYFDFRETFFDMGQCSPASDRILSRCIAELANLIDIEKSYPDQTPLRAFDFFNDYLAEKGYLARQTETGVNLIPYRAAAGAPCGCSIIIGASQQALSVTVRQLPFLREDKRRRLKLEDKDISVPFITLYGIHSAASPALFTCAEKSFTGYAIPHSALLQIPQTGGADQDAYAREQEWYTNPRSDFPAYIYSAQKNGFAAWARQGAPFSNREQTSSLHETVMQLTKEKLFKEIDGEPCLRISATGMNTFFRCPVQWLFSQTLSLDTFASDTELIPANITGLVYHKALHDFFTAVKNASGGILQPPQDADAWYVRLLSDCVETTLAHAKAENKIDGAPVSVIGAELLLSRKTALIETLAKCMSNFLSYFAGYAVFQTEKKYSARFPGKPYYFTGILDLVLTDNEGNPAIIDFKTGNPPPRKECVYDAEEGTGLSNVQLAMYTDLYEREHGVPVDKVLFFSIRKAEAVVIAGDISGTGAAKVKNAKTRDEFQSTLDKFYSMAEEYARIVSGGGPFSAEQTPYETCSACMYRYICRTHYTVSGRKRKDMAI